MQPEQLLILTSTGGRQKRRRTIRKPTNISRYLSYGYSWFTSPRSWI